MGLSVALVDSALTAPIRTGSVADAALAFDLTFGTIDDISRAVIAGRYDVAEMSLATYLMALARGADLVGVPAFFGRRFQQQCIGSASSAPIVTPHDLRGKRVALRRFWGTPAVWLRGLLLHEYGIGAHEIEWVTTQPERIENAFTPGVHVTALDDDSQLRALLADGTVDAILTPTALRPDAGMTLLFEDSAAAALDFLHRTGIFPLCYAVVVRGPLARERPELGAALFRLLARARDRALAETPDAVESPLAGLALTAATALLGDPYPFGRAANAASIEAFLGYAHEQDLTPRRLTLEETFLDLD